VLLKILLYFFCSSIETVKNENNFIIVMQLFNSSPNDLGKKFIVTVAIPDFPEIECSSKISSSADELFCEISG